MKYFCAQCQARYSVTDIAADFRTISLQEINDNLSSLLGQNTGGEDDLERFTLSNHLMKFVNTNAQGGLSLLFPGRDIPKYLVDSHQQGKVLSGQFRLTLEWLLLEYQKSTGVQEGQTPEKLLGLDSVIKEIGQRPIFDREINFFFDKIDGEDVLNYMTADNNDPFTDENNIMRGYLRACPHCGYHVSRAVGKAEEIVIALAGSPRAGKSSCLTAIASSLVSGRYRDEGFSMEPFEFDQSWDDIRKEIALFDEGYAVTKTPVNLHTVPSYSFLVRFFEKKRVLTFVDMPGEYWQNGSGLSREFFIQYAGLYRNIDCIWFFISKLMARDVNLGNGEQAWQRELMRCSAEDGEILRQGSAANLNSNLTALKEFLVSYGVPVPPTAIILSKVEMNLGGNDSALTEEYLAFPVSGELSVASKNQQDIARLICKYISRPKARVLDEYQYFTYARYVREFLRAVNPGICYAIEQNCPDRSYIAMAAYGHPAVRQSEPMSFTSDSFEEAMRATPFHEMFPLIWTLAIMGVIDIKHPCTYRWKAGVFGRIETENCEEIVSNFRYSSLRTQSEDGHQSRDKEDRAKKVRNIGSNLLLKKAKTNGEFEFSRTIIDHKKG